MAELVAWLRGIDRENRGMVIDRVNREWARLAWRRHLASLPPPERGPTWLQRFWLRVRITRALEDGRPLCRLSCAERRWMQPPRSGCVVLPCRGCGRSLHVNEAHASDTRNTWFFCCSGCHPVAMQVIDEPERRTKARAKLKAELRKQSKRPFVFSSGRDRAALSADDLGQLDPEEHLEYIRRPWALGRLR